MYRELGRVLLGFEEDQGRLLEILRGAEEVGHKVVSLRDRDASGGEVALDGIDPFTFFASFNRGGTDDNRKRLLAYLKETLSLSAELPEDFLGIPVMHPQASWFFAYRHRRGPEDIPMLWQLARQAVEGGCDGIDGELFGGCLGIKGVGMATLTMGLFWLRPDELMPVDKNSTAALRKLGYHAPITDWDSYLHAREAVKHSGKDCLVLNGNEVFFSGHSFKDLGSRYSFFAAVRARDATEATLRKYAEVWREPTARMMITSSVAVDGDQVRASSPCSARTDGF